MPSSPRFCSRCRAAPLPRSPRGRALPAPGARPAPMAPLPPDCPAALTIFGQALDHLHGRLEPGGVHRAGLGHGPGPSLPPARLQGRVRRGRLGSARLSAPAAAAAACSGAVPGAAGPYPASAPAPAPFPASAPAPRAPLPPAGPGQPSQHLGAASPRTAAQPRAQPSPTSAPASGAHVTSPAAPCPSRLPHRPEAAGARRET